MREAAEQDLFGPDEEVAGHVLAHWASGDEDDEENVVREESEEGDAIRVVCNLYLARATAARAMEKAGKAASQAHNAMCEALHRVESVRLKQAANMAEKRRATEAAREAANKVVTLAQSLDHSRVAPGSRVRIVSSRPGLPVGTICTVKYVRHENVYVTGPCEFIYKFEQREFVPVGDAVANSGSPVVGSMVKILSHCALVSHLRHKTGKVIYCDPLTRDIVVRLEDGTKDTFTPGEVELCLHSGPRMKTSDGHTMVSVGSTVRILYTHQHHAYLVGQVGQISEIVDADTPYPRCLVDLPAGARSPFLYAVGIEAADTDNSDVAPVVVPGGFSIGDRVRRVTSVSSASQDHFRRPFHPGHIQQLAADAAGVVVGGQGAGVSAMVLVRFGSAGYNPSYRQQAPVAVHPALLVSEVAWFERIVMRCSEGEPGLHKQLEEARASEAKARQESVELQAKVPPLLSAHQKAARALKKATDKGERIAIVSRVQFKNKTERPTVWRDLAKHVEYDWAVRVGEGVRPLLLSLAEAAVLARAMGNYDAHSKQEHVLSAVGRPLQSLREGKARLPKALKGGLPIIVREKDATTVLRKLKKGTRPDPLHSFSLLKAALGAQKLVYLDNEVQEFFDGPGGLIRTKEVTVPAVLQAVLRPYQRVGFQWLVNNALNGLGSILADDMGLGKTIQTIAFLLYAKQQGFIKRPALIIVPKGLLSTWSREIEKWAPELKVHTFYGNERRFLAGAVPGASLDATASTAASTVTPAVPALASTAALSRKRRLTGKQPASVRVTEEAAPATEAAAQAANAETADVAVGAMPVHQRQRGERRAFEFDEGSADVFLTSYGTFRADAERIAKEQVFGSIILDEAQQIKNYSSQISKAVKRMAETVGDIRIALSGTPVENALSDLHSQFEFVLPGYLAASRMEFERDFSKPISQPAKGGGPAATEEASACQRLLQRMIQPFVLRRLKSDPNIAPDLPEKVEQTYECELSEGQSQLYKAVQEVELESLNVQGPNAQFARHGRVLAMIHALREVCNHPANLKAARRPPSFNADRYPRSMVEASGKCSVLHELLDGIILNGEKAIIFSSYLDTIDILEEQIKERFNCRTLKFVGALDKAAREKVVDDFQTDPACSVLLLSLQAGGVGITLTAATHVIHFDRCYNPARENQATDRAHRIGQKKTVFVHRLVTKGTFEERLSAIMARKQSLSDLTVTAGEGWIADLSDAELRDLFSLSGSNSKGSAAASSSAPPAKRRRRGAEAAA